MFAIFSITHVCMRVCVCVCVASHVLTAILYVNIIIISELKETAINLQMSTMQFTCLL